MISREASAEKARTFNSLFTPCRSLVLPLGISCMMSLAQVKPALVRIEIAVEALMAREDASNDFLSEESALLSSGFFRTSSPSLEYNAEETN